MTPCPGSVRSDNRRTPVGPKGQRTEDRGQKGLWSRSPCVCRYVTRARATHTHGSSDDMTTEGRSLLIDPATTPDVVIFRTVGDVSAALGSLGGLVRYDRRDKVFRMLGEFRPQLDTWAIRHGVEILDEPAHSDRTDHPALWQQTPATLRILAESRARRGTPEQDETNRRGIALCRAALAGREPFRTIDDDDDGWPP